MKNDLFADALDYQDNRNKGGNSLFLWTIFLLFLTGFALAAWIASYYIFGQPERPDSYEILQKLKKIEPSKKFAVTAAPNGEFVTAAKFYERYSPMPRYEIDKVNTDSIRDFIKNYKQSKHRICYLTGKYKVLKTQVLGDETLFSSGVAAYAESVDEPRVLIEYIYSAEPKKNSQIQKAIFPGAEISLAKTNELCAVIHIQKLVDNRLLATVLPLHYGTYGGNAFTLDPPEPLNLRAGWPVMRASLPDRMLEVPTAVAEATPVSTPQAAPTPAVVVAAATPAATPESAPTPIAMSTPFIASATPLPAPGYGSPQATPPRALPVEPRPLASAPPTASLPPPATNIPPATGNPPRALPTGTPMAMVDGNIPVLPAVPVTTTSTGGGSWPTYKPGEAPPGREMDVNGAADLADRGIAGERLYLDGSFVVTAANENRAIMRGRNFLGRRGAARVIADFPPGISPPTEGSVVTRDSRRPFQIMDVKRTSNDEVNIFVREIIE